MWQGQQKSEVKKKSVHEVEVVRTQKECEMA